MSYSRALMMNYWGAAENPRREEARREENTYYLTTRDLQYTLEAELVFSAALFFWPQAQ